MQLVACESYADVDERRTVLEKLVHRHHLQKRSCTIVLGTDFYQLVQVNLADLPPEERHEAARWQIRERLDYPPEEAVLDLFEVPSFAGDKKPVTYAVSARKSVLKERLELLRDVGLKLEVIDVPEFALRNIAALFTEDKRGVAVLLLFEHNGMLVIAREGTLYLVRLFSTGMQDLLPFAAGDYESLTDKLDAIVLEVQRSFDFCESTFHLPQAGRLLIAQTGQEIPAVTSYLNEFLSTGVEPFSFAAALKTPAGVDQLELNRNLLAIGGALRREEM